MRRVLGPHSQVIDILWLREYYTGIWRLTTQRKNASRNLKPNTTLSVKARKLSWSWWMKQKFPKRSTTPTQLKIPRSLLRKRKKSCLTWKSHATYRCVRSLKQKILPELPATSAPSQKKAKSAKKQYYSFTGC